MQAKCPMDRTPLPSLAHVMELPEVMPEMQDEDADDIKPVIDGDNEANLKSSAKIQELVKYLKAFPKGQKSLVFSQFTKFLSTIEPHLVKEGINCVRFDGSLTPKRRAQIIADFQSSTTDEQNDGSENSVQADEDSGSETEMSEDEKPAIKKGNGNGKGKGKGKAKARDTQDNGPTVMLISLKAGSVGLNLTAAQVSCKFIM